MTPSSSTASKTLAQLYQSYARKTSSTREKILFPVLDESHQKSLSEKTFKTIKKFVNVDADTQRTQLVENSEEIAAALIDSLYSLTKDKAFLNYIMINIDAIILDDPDNVKVFIESSKKNPKRNLLKFLQQIFTDKEVLYNSSFTESSVRIFCAILANFNYSSEFALDTKSFLLYLITSVVDNKKLFSEYVTAYACAHLLIVPGMTAHFINANGLKVLLDILDISSKDLQTAYFTLISLWILSYEETFKKFVADPKNLVVSRIVSCVKKIARDKLLRVSLKIFINLLDNQDCIMVMIDNNVFTFLKNELKKNIKDAKVKENITTVMGILEKNYRFVSTWDKYIKELKTEKLTFGPCHNENFWKEHVKRVEEGEFWAIKKLVELLDSSDKITQSVACFDIGEFSRLHPYAKMVLEKEQGKDKLMLLVNNDDSTLREAALIAVQKLMVSNWQLAS